MIEIQLYYSTFAIICIGIIFILFIIFIINEANNINLKYEIDNKDKEINQLKISNNNNNLKNEIENKDKEINQLKNILDDFKFNKLEIIKDKNKENYELRKLLANKDKEIYELKIILENKDKEIYELKITDAKLITNKIFEKYK
jgi:hypothetical protein